MFSGDLKSIVDACSTSGVSSAYLIAVNSYPFIWLNPSLKKKITNFRGLHILVGIIRLSLLK